MSQSIKAMLCLSLAFVFSNYTIANEPPALESVFIPGDVLKGMAQIEGCTSIRVYTALYGEDENESVMVNPVAGNADMAGMQYQYFMGFDG